MLVTDKCKSNDFFIVAGNVVYRNGKLAQFNARYRQSYNGGDIVMRKNKSERISDCVTVKVNL